MMICSVCLKEATGWHFADKKQNSIIYEHEDENRSCETGPSMVNPMDAIIESMRQIQRGDV